MSAEGYDVRSNRSNIIPVIIDFHWSSKQMRRFENRYSRAPFVLISSREFFDYLKDHGCRLKLYHFPLSLPDLYKIVPDDWGKRPFDLVLMGRQNTKLKEYLERYCAIQTDLTYLFSKFENGTLNYYSNKGEFVATVWDRNDYWKVLKMGKVSFHSTPGIDGGEKRTMGFNQVTPKGFEILAAGCNVLMRYRVNSDTDYFEYSKRFKNIHTYAEFEDELVNSLESPPDYLRNQLYLDKHYTSNRMAMLEEILDDHFSLLR